MLLTLYLFQQRHLENIISNLVVLCLFWFSDMRKYFSNNAMLCRIEVWPNICKPLIAQKDLRILLNLNIEQLLELIKKNIFCLLLYMG